MALNGIFHLFFEMKLSDLHLILEDFKKKEHNKKLCKESFENRLYGILHTCIKGPPVIFKHTTIQTFVFISSKVVYFLKHLAYKV